jgi:hypothetical protein
MGAEKATCVACERTRSEATCGREPDAPEDSPQVSEGGAALGGGESHLRGFRADEK